MGFGALLRNWPALRFTVLLVQDDIEATDVMQKHLGSHGILVRQIAEGPGVAREVTDAQPDLVLMDLSLRGSDAYALCKDIRQATAVPIVLLSAQGSEEEVVRGLEAGADDHVRKTVPPLELCARLRAHVRRARGLLGPSGAAISRNGPLEIDATLRSATFHGQTLALTDYEFALLSAFTERVGQVLTREQLIELVRCRPEEAFDRSIDVHVSHLRQKLGDNPRNPKWLKTVRGIGYVFVEIRTA